MSDPFVEITRTHRAPNERRRRWFSSQQLDLIVWCHDDGTPESFQLCYDKGRAEKALNWSPQRGFAHYAVDDGESEIGTRHKASPLLTDARAIDVGRVFSVYDAAHAALPSDVHRFVSNKLRDFLESSR